MAAANEKVVWVNLRKLHFLYFIVPQPRSLGGFNPSFCKPLNNIADGYVCTLGAGSSASFHPGTNKLAGVYNIPEHLWVAKENFENPDSGDLYGYTSSEIKPPRSFWNFVEDIFTFSGNYRSRGMKGFLEHIEGTQDSVAYINTLLKVAGVPGSRRMLGGGKGLAHHNLLDETLFTDPNSLAPDKSRIPLDPNAKNPPGMPKLLPGQRIHNVVSGDWLSKIAQQYYGDMMKYKALYDWKDNLNGNWNRKEIGSNPDLIEVGMRIIIPPSDQIR